MIDTAPFLPPVNIPLRELLKPSKRHVMQRVARTQMRAFSKKEKHIFNKRVRVILTTKAGRAI